MGCLCLLGLSPNASPLRADILAFENFAYDNGPLGGNTGGVGWTYGWIANPLSVVVENQQALTTAPGNPPLYGVRGFQNPESTENLFVSFEITTSSISNTESLGAITSVGANNPQLSFGKFNGGTQWALGPSGAVTSGIEIQPHTTYHLIGAYHSQVIGSDFLMLWVDPDAADYFDPVNLSHSADAVSFQGVFGSSFDLTIFSEMPGVRFDNIVISNDPAAVGLNTRAVPEPGILGIGLVLAVVIAGRRADRSVFACRSPQA